MTTRTQRKPRQRKTRQRATVKRAGELADEPCAIGERYTLPDDQGWVSTPLYDQVVRELGYDPLPGVAN